MPLITADDIRAYLADIEDGESVNALLTTIASRASDIVLGALAKAHGAPITFGYTEGTRIVRGYGTNYLYLPPHEPGSVTAVAWGLYPVATTDYTYQDGVLLYVGSNLFWRGVWGSGILYIVTARWGYGDPPPALIEVAVEVGVSLYLGRDKGMWTDSTGVEGANIRRFTGGLTRQQTEMIQAVAARYQARIPTI